MAGLSAISLPASHRVQHPAIPPFIITHGDSEGRAHGASRSCVPEAPGARQGRNPGAPRLRSSIDDMIHTMARCITALGLAAPQVHESVRHASSPPSMPPRTMTRGRRRRWRSSTRDLRHRQPTWSTTGKGCLSIPDIRGRVRARAESVRAGPMRSAWRSHRAARERVSARASSSTRPIISTVSLFVDRMNASFETLTLSSTNARATGQRKGLRRDR